MGAGLDDFSMMQQVDVVRDPGGTQPVGDDGGGAVWSG
jgi:hypothetical protein